MIFDVGDSGGVGVQCVGYVGLGQVVPFAVCCQGAGGVGWWGLGQGAVDLAGDGSFEAADDFFGGFAFLGASVGVVLGGGVVA